jgi:tetratricopeptide (TPR) repeat protein
MLVRGGFSGVIAPRFLATAYVFIALTAVVALSWKECVGLAVFVALLALLRDRTLAAATVGAVAVTAGTAAVVARGDGAGVAWFATLMRTITVVVVAAQLVLVAAGVWKSRPRRGPLLTAALTCVALGLLSAATGLVLGAWSSIGVAYPLLSCGLFLIAVSPGAVRVPGRALLVSVAAFPLLVGVGKLSAGRIVATRDPRGGWDDMVAHYQRAVWLDPTGLAPRRELAYSLAAGGRVGAALSILEGAMGLRGLDVGSPRMRAIAEAEVGLWSHAVFSMAPSARFEGQEWLELGGLLADEVESRRAASRAHLNLAWYLRLSDREEEAAEVLRQALLAGPQLRGLHYNLGLLLEDMSLSSLAAMEFEAESLVFPDSPDTWLRDSPETEHAGHLDTLLEAESMRATVGKPFEEGWGLYGAGELEDGFFLEDGGWRALGVVAQGSRADGVWPIMTVWLDQSEAGRWVVCGDSWTPYWLVGGFAPGAHSLRVRFENDYSSPDGSEDRNLWVDKVVMVRPTGAEPLEELLGKLCLERVRILGGTIVLGR